MISVILGDLRVEKTMEVMKIIDLALLVLNGNQTGEFEDQLMDDFYEAGIPYLFVHKNQILFRWILLSAISS